MMQSLFTFLKFALVGLGGVVIDFSITWLIKEKIKWSPYIANASGFLVAASVNWYLNRIWSFESQNQDILMEYSNFIGVALLGLLINTSILFLSIKRLNLNFYLAKTLAIGITTIWNFLANYFYTFAG